MASFTEHETLDISDFFSPLTVFYDFPIPKTKHFDFAASFTGYLEDESTKKFISTLSSGRSSMESTLASFSSTLEAKLAAVDEYYPHLQHLLDSLNRQPPVEVRKPLEFHWKGSITNVDKYAEYSVLVYDLAMTLFTKSILHYKIAEENAQNITGISTAGQHLVSAASVMHFISTELLPKWGERYDSMKSERPPEMQERVCLSLYSLFKSTAAKMTLSKALVKEGGTGFSVLVKLAHAYSEDAKEAVNTLKHEPSIKNIVPDLLAYLRFNGDLAVAISYALLGQTLVDAHDLGKAIYCFDLCLGNLKEQSSRKYDIHSSGIPKLSGQLSKAAAPISGIVKAVTAIKTSCKRENDLIYFQDIPTNATSPDLPAAVHVLKISTFDSKGRYDETNIVTFIKDPPKKGFFGSIVASLTSKPSDVPTVNAAAVAGATASATPVVEAQPSRPRSDSDIAREFQRRINMGENL